MMSLCFQQLPLSVVTRRYSHMDMPKLTPDDVKRRVMMVCRNFEKISEDEVSCICELLLTCMCIPFDTMLVTCICYGLYLSVYSSITIQSSNKIQ